MKSLNKSDPLPMLTFRLGEQEYALSIDEVVEVASMVELTTLPDSAPGMLGIANRHGAMLPILDLRQFLENKPTPIDSSTLFIVVTHDGQVAGLVVDEVHQVEYVDPEAKQPVPAAGRFIRDIVSHKGQLMHLISIPQLLGTVGEGLIEGR